MFPDRTFEITRSPPGGPKSDTFTALIDPTTSGFWSVRLEGLSGSAMIIQVYHSDGGVPLLVGSAKLRDVGTSTVPISLIAGQHYQVQFTPYGKSGVSVLTEHFLENVPPVACFSVTPESPVVGEPVAFDASCSYDSDGSIRSYIWDFGDGASGDGVSVSHTFTSEGSLAVALTVRDDLEGWGCLTKNVLVTAPANLPPVADFSFTPPNPIVQDLISFDASLSSDADGFIASYAWDFGDGASADFLDPTHAYASEGTYAVTLTVTDDDGATGTASKTVVVAPNAPPVAAFSWSPLTPKATFDTVSFTAAASHDPDGFIASYAWDFGDGASASGVTADHLFALAGDYVVSLTVTDNRGATGSLSQTVRVVENAAPIADFSWSPLAPKEGAPVSFDASGSSDPDGSIVTYAWDFGDGSAASGVAASHVFAAGTWAVHLTVTDNNGATGALAVDLVVAANAAPIACFAFVVDGIMVGTPVAFDGACSYDADGFIASYAWDFGDGATATGMAVSHSFGSAGDFLVTLTVTDDSGAFASSQRTAHVQANEIPVAVISYAPLAPLSLELVTFDGSGSYDPLPPDVVVAYAWAFADDASHATGAIVTHTFAHPGTWTVTLEVTDSYGAKGSATADVVVANRAPAAVLSVSPLSVLTGEPVTADAAGSSDPDGSIASVHIDWGDASAADASPASHAYADNGVYTVTLTVVDNDGASGTATASVTVSDRPPVPFLQVSPDHGKVGTVFSADGSGSSDPDGTIVSYDIAWGDGAHSGTAVATHAYAANGVYTITLTVTDDDGNAASASLDVTVANQPPVARLAVSPTSVLTGETVTADASGSSDPDGDALTYLIAWGDGSTDSASLATHAYVQNGLYTITLTVTDSVGASATATQGVTVADRAPHAALSVSPDSGTLDTVFSADASASSDPDGTIVSYDIAWGDGSSSAGPLATHSYSGKGTFTIVVTVTDDDGSTATASASVNVANQPPAASLTVSPATVLTGEVVGADASGSSDPDGDALTYTIAWGDGATSSAAVASHAYAENGVFTVRLTVTDAYGAFAVASATVTVLNRAPTAHLVVTPLSVQTLEDVFADGSGSSDADGVIASFHIDWGDGSAIDAASGHHRYASAGVYRVLLTIVDNDGASASAFADVSVADRPPIAVFTFSPASPSHGVLVAFDASGSSDPDGTIVGFVWNFGDASSGSGSSASHAFAAPGTYTVVLTVTDDDGSLASVSHDITVINLPPVARLGVSPGTVLTGETVQADASLSSDPEGDALTYAIAWGDGATSSAAMATHAYAENGVYTVTVTVTDAYGAFTTASASVTVLNRAPAAHLSVSPLSVLTADLVTADAAGSNDVDGTIASYLIEWGDGATSSLSLATHAYAENGVYAVRLTIVDNDGSSASATASVTVSDRPPVAAFTFSPASPSHGVSVAFDGSGSSDVDGAVVGFAWTFGDGGTASGSSPNHAFAVPGTYTVTLTVTDNDGSTASVSHDVVVGNLPPTARLSVLPGSVLTGEIVTADGSLSSDPDADALTYAIAWGDGASSNAALATHSYAENGVFTVTLTVTDLYGASASATASVTVNNRPPTAVLSVNPLSVLTADTVTADAAGSGDVDGSIASFHIAWGDGSSANVAHATHAYADNGVYTVTLTVVDNDGASATATASVTVADRPPVAAFTFGPDGASHGVSVAFDGSGSSDVDGSIAAYAWNFGDGHVGSGATVSHAFAAPGTYTVTLDVTDNDGSTASVGHSVLVVNLAPVARLSVTPSTVLTGESVSADASSSSDPEGDALTYAIAWGDGATSSAALASHSYVQNGVYTVTLTVTDAFGAWATATAGVTVQDRAPVARLSVTPTSVLTGELVTADGSSSSDPDGSIATYHIAWGDGSDANGPTATHAYADNGDFTVTLTVTDDDGSVGAVSQVVHVADRPPVAAFTFTPSNPTTGQLIYFDAAGSSDADGSIVAYAWDFGDGNTATGAQVDKAYASAGTFTVTLTVTDNDGSTASHSESVVVTSSNLPPVAAFGFAPASPKVGESVTFDASASTDPDGTIASYAWDFGDGGSATGLSASHAFASASTFHVTLTVTDNLGATDALTRDVVVTAVLGPGEDWTFYDFFNVPYGEWWDIRNSYAIFGGFAEPPIGADCFTQAGIDNYWCTPGGTLPALAAYPYMNWARTPVGDFVITAPYRFTADIRGNPAMTMDQPLMLPKCADLQTAAAAQGVTIVCPVAPPSGGEFSVDEHISYMTTLRAQELALSGCPDLTYANDGYLTELMATITMDAAAAARIFGITDTTALNFGTTATSLLKAGCGTGIAPTDAPSGVLEMGLKAWFEAQGNGPYDVLSMNNLALSLKSIDASGSYDAGTGKYTLVLDLAGWGFEQLFARWAYWGSAGYVAGLSGAAPTGWWGMEVPWLEDLSFHATVGATGFNAQVGGVIQYHFRASASAGTDAVWRTADDVPMWIWQPALGDRYPGVPGHMTSELKPYQDAASKYVHTTPGSTKYGVSSDYDYAPAIWALKAGETQKFMFPTTPVLLFDPYASLRLDKPIGLVTVSGVLTLGTTSPASGVGTYDAATNTLTVVGPISVGTYPTTTSGKPLESRVIYRLVKA